MTVSFYVLGNAAPQGSMKSVGKGRLISSSKFLPAWRKLIVEAAQAKHGYDWEPMDGALGVIVEFYLPRPKTTKYKQFPAGTPDLDKLQRALGDALTIAGTIKDDARIVDWSAKKRWAIGCEPGAAITVFHKEGL